MIEINLLPSELRPRLKIFEFSKEIVIFASMAFFLILVAIYLLFAGMVAVQRGGLKKWERELSKIEIPRQELKQLKQRIRVLQDLTGKADELIHHSILWSRNLNRISELLQPGIWLTQLSLQKITVSRGNDQASEFYLVMKGRAYSRSQEETAQVGRYISALKADESFFRYFKDIQLENIERRRLGGVNAAEFNMICPLKSDEGK